MVSSCILDQDQQTASHAERSIENCHRMHTRHKCTTSVWRNTLTSHTRAPTSPRLTIQTENTTSITQTYNILQDSKVKKAISSTTPNTQQAFPTDPHTVTTTDIKINMRHIQTYIVSGHLVTRGNNKILRTPPQQISSSEEIFPYLTRRTLAQLRTNKSPIPKSYLHKVDAKSHQSSLFPTCNIHTHNAHHLLSCTRIRTTLSPLKLWTDPDGVTELLARWKEKLASGPQAGKSDFPH